MFIHVMCILDLFHHVLYLLVTMHVHLEDYMDTSCNVRSADQAQDNVFLCQARG